MRRGLRVAVFKCGPDYLDPTYHKLASGQTAHNLDSWLMGPDALRETFVRHAAHADIALIEGVMGLFDGASPTELTGSSAQIAEILSAPIALVCDASGMARSVAALAHGFGSFEPGITLGGLICNHVGSVGHLELLRRACEPRGVRVLGGLLDNPAHAFPERHLGLHSAHELDLEASIDDWAARIEQHCDVPLLLELARSAPALPLAAAQSTATAPRCRIAVARDEAFHFYYDANLHLLERAGAELCFFSPLHDALPPTAAGVYIGGGYPELYAAELASNTPMLEALRAYGTQGVPFYAECGGLMYLSDAIVTLEGASHPMLGLVRGVAAMSDRLQALGYVEVETREPSLLGPTGTRFRGHQFRYSHFRTALEPARYAVQTKRSGQLSSEGYGAANVVASYIHAHWASNPAIASAFVAACERVST
jgi:cobyrinic acid a,c-diamide synthase